MFEIPDTKTIMDTVHGYINIPKVFVENIVDTEWFQRLRFIDQTGMKILYPDGKHDRFGHSLGVYHLGQKAVDNLLKDFSNNLNWNVRSDNSCNNFWAKNKVLFLLACLLHDIGHAPFSHALEKILIKNSEGIEKRLAETINKLERNSKEVNEDFIIPPDIKAAAHERMGALLVIEHFKSSISEILEKLHKEKYPVQIKTNYSEYAKPVPAIDNTEINFDICFMARMILGLKYKSYLPEKQIRNCFIELLNSENFDVDKLDYIIRDTKMSGISNVSVDVERLIGALTLVVATKYKNHTFDQSSGDFGDGVFIKELCIQEDNVLKIEGDLSAIFKLSSGTEVTIKKGGTFLSLKASSDLSEDNWNKAQIQLCHSAEFDGKTELYVDKSERPRSCNKEGEDSIVWSETEEPHSIYIKNAITKNNFKFRVVGKSPFDLEIKGKCEVEIKGKANTDSSILKGKIKGSCSEMIVAGDYLQKKNRIPTSNEYNEFSIGFKKQAMNLIANVLDARDYLYLWIYAHHKVIYYANFLIPTLSRTVSKFVEKDGFLLWRLSYDDILKLDDSYLMTAMKYVEQKYEKELLPQEKELLRELFERRYKKSLYKSLAEYDIFFVDFTIPQRMLIRKHLSELSGKGRDEDITSGVFTGEVIGRIAEVSGIKLDFLEELVWVDASYKQKRLDYQQTYFVFPYETVTMKRLELLTEQASFTSRTTSHYFYLYYKINPHSEPSVANTIKEALLLYFNKVI